MVRITASQIKSGAANPAPKLATVVAGTVYGHFKQGAPYGPLYWANQRCHADSEISRCLAHLAQFLAEQRAMSPTTTGPLQRAHLIWTTACASPRHQSRHCNVLRLRWK